MNSTHKSTPTTPMRWAINLFKFIALLALSISFLILSNNEIWKIQICILYIFIFMTLLPLFACHKETTSLFTYTSLSISICTLSATEHLYFSFFIALLSSLSRLCVHRTRREGVIAILTLGLSILSCTIYYKEFISTPLTPKELSFLAFIIGTVIHKILEEAGLTQQFDDFIKQRPELSVAALFAIAGAATFTPDPFGDSPPLRAFYFALMTLFGFVTSDASDAVREVVKASGLVKGKPTA